MSCIWHHRYTNSAFLTRKEKTNITERSDANLFFLIDIQSMLRKD